MASNKQLKANKANAQRSTGPRTQAGKARSRLNSRKHGLTARLLVIGDEDPEQFEALRAALVEEFRPSSGMAQELVERLATLLWRLRRVPVLEAAIFEALRGEQKAVPDKEAERRRRLAAASRRFLPNLPEKNEEKEDEDIAPALRPDEQARDDRRIIGLALIKDGQHHDTLGKLSRYEVSLMNGLRNTLQTLNFVQNLESESRLTAMAPRLHQQDKRES